MFKNQNQIFTIAAIYLPVIFWLLVLIYLLILKDYSTAIFLTLGGIMLRAVCEIIYFFYKKPRPYQLLNVKPVHSAFMLSGLHTKQDSFPSAHAAVMFYGAFFLSFSGFYVLGGFAFLAAVLTSVARVRLLYHYTIDMWAGAALASIWLIFMAFVARI